ncbi:hypothetical protein F1559_004508 [Cyanidiococcus yangmingshanensis]|uniref:Uncharacterized protein n=1 Tax=Cyanidiococcus yangmingshanensis TaxID=2690220 RepID=A0A7J7IJV3_9RHOD|nr:hypothetical protein F1559_004508 [Cyanidiococcus yangmingshanensis]
MTVVNKDTSFIDALGPRPQALFRIRKVPLPAWACVFDTSACRRDVSQLHQELEADGWNVRLLLGAEVIPRESGAYRPGDREKWVEVLEQCLGASGAAAARGKRKVGSGREATAAPDAAGNDIHKVPGADSGSRSLEPTPDGKIRKNNEEGPADTTACSVETGLTAAGSAASHTHTDDRSPKEPSAPNPRGTASEVNGQTRAEGADSDHARALVSASERHMADSMTVSMDGQGTQVADDATRYDQENVGRPQSNGIGLSANHASAADRTRNVERDTRQPWRLLHQSIDEATKREMLARYAPIGVDLQDLTWGAFVHRSKHSSPLTN